MKLTTIRNKLGFIPEAHFENEPAGPPPKNVTLPKKWVDKIKEHDDKYKPGDLITGY